MLLTETIKVFRPLYSIQVISQHVSGQESAEIVTWLYRAGILPKGKDTVRSVTCESFMTEEQMEENVVAFADTSILLAFIARLCDKEKNRAVLREFFRYDARPIIDRNQVQRGRKFFHICFAFEGGKLTVSLVPPLEPDQLEKYRFAYAQMF